MTNSMTNYNERLDKIFAPLIDSPSLTLTTTYWDEAKADLTSLIKELVAEAKPEVKAHPLGPVTLADCQRGLDQFEQNLLKALEEVE